MYGNGRLTTLAHAELVHVVHPVNFTHMMSHETVQHYSQGTQGRIHRTNIRQNAPFEMSIFEICAFILVTGGCVCLPRHPQVIAPKLFQNYVAQGQRVKDCP